MSGNFTASQSWAGNEGFNQLTNNTDIIHAALIAWTEVGGESYVPGLITIGVIPLFIAIMVYVRYQKIAPSLFGMLISFLGLFAVQEYYNVIFVTQWVFGAVVLVMTIGVAIIMFAFTKRDQ